MKLKITTKKLPASENCLDYIVELSLKHDTIFIFRNQFFKIEDNLVSIFLNESKENDLPVKKFVINNKKQQFFPLQ